MIFKVAYDPETQYVVLNATIDDPDSSGPTFVRALSVVTDYGEILRIPFSLDELRIDHRTATQALNNLIAELKHLHSRGNDGIRDVCELCAELCHSHSGLMCDDEGDGAWPCATMKIVERYDNGG
jgi:hypothetical protein